MTRVLAFGSHPDDVEIFAGATLAALRRRGAELTLVHLTRGEAGTRGTAEQRREEATRAARVLGAAMEILDLGDGTMRDDERCRREVNGVIRRLRPDLILAPYASDDHPDHTDTGRLIKACWFLAGLRNAEPAGVAPHRAARLWFYFSHEVTTPTFIVEVSRDDVDTFQRAVQCYGSQLHDPESTEPATRLSRPGFVDELTARRRFYGALAGTEFGEPWWTPKPPLVPNPLALLPS